MASRALIVGGAAVLVALIIIVIAYSNEPGIKAQCPATRVCADKWVDASVLVAPIRRSVGPLMGVTASRATSPPASRSATRMGRAKPRLCRLGILRRLALEQLNACDACGSCFCDMRGVLFCVAGDARFCDTNSPTPQDSLLKGRYARCCTGIPLLAQNCNKTLLEVFCSLTHDGPVHICRQCFLALPASTLQARRRTGHRAGRV
jgi:hypothetical protein